MFHSSIVPDGEVRAITRRATIEAPRDARDHIPGRTMTRGNAAFFLPEIRDGRKIRVPLRGNASTRSIDPSREGSVGLPAGGGTGARETYLDELYRDRRFSDTAPTHDDELVGLRVALSVSGFRHLSPSRALRLVLSFARSCCLPALPGAARARLNARPARVNDFRHDTTPAARRVSRGAETRTTVLLATANRRERRAKAPRAASSAGSGLSPTFYGRDSPSAGSTAGRARSF